MLKRFAPAIFAALRPVERRYWERRGRDLMSFFQSCGTAVKISGRLTVTDPRSVAMGCRVTVGENGFWDSSGGLTIGDRVVIGREVTIETVERLPGADHRPEPRAVAIGQDAWIGDRAVILPGARIGAGAAIAPGAVVSGQVPPCLCSSGSSREGPPGAGEFAHGEDPRARLFFVVSTGRSGSMTIAKVLSQHPNVICHHEPRPQMIRLSSELAHGLRSREEVLGELKALYHDASLFPVDKVYGESDQKYWNLIPLLTELMPQARFIWLIRDGRSVIASKMARNWFAESEERDGDPVDDKLHRRWMFYRENGAECGSFSADDWAGMGVMERNCWAWVHVNRHIESSLSLLPSEQWMQLRVEEMKACTPDVFSFLGLPSVRADVRQYNQSSPSRNGGWNRWSSLEAKTFASWCGEAMDQWYPGWRADTGARRVSEMA